MKAILLSAGYGTRLRPITNHTPKVLVDIGGKPLLEYWLKNLTKIGINEILINTHYLHKQIEEFVQNSRYKKYITLTYEKKLLNTGGTVLSNKKFIGRDDFMLIHADNLCFCDFEAFLKAYQNRPSNCLLTMMLFKTDSPSSCGIVELDKSGIVTNFYEKVKNPPSNLANAAVYICSNDILNILEQFDKKEVDFSKDVIPKLLGKISTFTNDTYHRDIGTPDSYKKAQKEIEKFLLNINSSE